MTILSNPTQINQIRAQPPGSCPGEDCGEACVVSSLTDAGHPTTIPAVEQLVRQLPFDPSGIEGPTWNPDKGTWPKPLADILTESQVPASWFQCSSDELRSRTSTALARKHRSLTCIKVYQNGYPTSEPVTPPNVFPQRVFAHWVVVYGLDGHAYHCMNPIEWNGTLLQAYPHDLFESAYYGVGVEIQHVMPADVPHPLPPQLPRWHRLGGKVAGGISAVSNQDGRLEVLVRGIDGQLYHKYQTAPGKGWSKKFEPLGGQITGRIVALSGRNDGRISVFARGTDSALYHMTQTAPDKGWSGWTPLDDPSQRVAIEDLFVGEQNQDDRIELFAVRPDGVVVHRAQAQAGGSWSSWSPLGGAMRAGGALAAITDGNGLLEVFARDPNGGVHHIRQHSPGDDWSASKWETLGGTIGELMTVARNQNGHLVVFARGKDGSLEHIPQIQSGHWAPHWTSLGGHIDDVLAVAANKDGRLEVFGRGADRSLYHIWQDKPNGHWSKSWASLGGQIADLLAVGVNHDHRLEVFARGTDDAVYHIWQKTPGGAWEDVAGESAALASPA